MNLSNLTRYFNLNGAPHTLSDHEVELATPQHLSLSSSQPGIPTGSIDPHPLVPASGSFPLSTASNPDILPIDDCFIIDTDPASIPLDTRSHPLRQLALVKGRKTKIVLKVESTEPAFQFYTGKFLDVPPWKAGKGEDGKEYEGGEGWGKFSGFCVEPSRYVDAANRDEWRGMCLLKRGETFGFKTRYWAFVE